MDTERDLIAALAAKRSLFVQGIATVQSWLAKMERGDCDEIERERLRTTLDEVAVLDVRIAQLHGATQAGDRTTSEELAAVIERVTEAGHELARHIRAGEDFARVHLLRVTQELERSTGAQRMHQAYSGTVRAAHTNPNR